MGKLYRTAAVQRGEPSGGIGVMALAGGFLAVFSLLMSRVFPELPWHLVFPALLGGGLGWTRGLLDGSASRALLGLAVGGSAGALVGAGVLGNALLACGVFGGLLGTVQLLDDRRPRLFLSSVMTTGLLSVTGAACASVLLSAPALPEMLSIGLAGVIFGTAVGTSQVVRLRSRDLLLRRYHRLRDAARGELGQVLEALLREYVKLEQILQGRGALAAAERRRLRGQVAQLMERILDTAEREGLIEQELQRVRPADIEQRWSEVRRRIDSSADDTVRQQYGEALENLQQQGESYRALERSRERLLSRLTNFLTSMQNLYLALVNLELAENDGPAGPEGELASRLKAVGDEVAGLRNMAEELSLRRRLEELGEEPATAREQLPPAARA